MATIGRLGREALVLAWVALLSAVPALAQNRTATILVDVSQGGGKATGVTVAATNANTGATTPAIARADGSHALTALEPGEYVIVASQAGGKEVYRTVTVQVGQTLNLDLDLEKEMQGETMIVQGSTVEAPTSELAVNVRREQINNLPQSNRNFLNFAQLAPGVRVSNNEFDKNFSSGALAARNTNVFVDGVSLKNNINEGGIVGQDASRGSPFPQLAISGFRVISQNYKAEYEQAGAAIISATTRSGGNDYQGDLIMTFQNQALMAQDYFAFQRSEPKPDLARFQLGAAAGGPVVKDKLHFFGTYETNIEQRSNRVTLGNRTADNLARFGEYEGSFGSPFREHLGFGKLSWRPAANQTVDVTAFVRAETDIRSFGGVFSFESGELIRNNVITASARHQLWLASLTNEATFQFLTSQFNPTAQNLSLIGRDYEGVIRLGGRDTNQDIGQQAFTLRDDVTFPGVELLGQHVVKTGATLSFQNYRVEKAVYGNPVFRFRQDAANNLSYDFPAEASYGLGDPRVTSNNTRFGVYVQDDWEIAKRLTLNLGIRWDVETNPLNNNYVTPDEVRAAARQLADIVAPLNGSDFFPVDNYLTDGKQRPPFLGAIQPRLGVALDVLGNGKTVLFGGAGRYYDRTLFNTGVDERYRLPYQTRTFRFSADGSPRFGLPTIPWRPEYLSKAGLDSLIASGTAPSPEIYLLENDTKPLHSDQFSAGVRQYVGPITASVTVSHIRSENGVGFYPANRKATGNRDFLPTPGGFGNVLISVDDREAFYTGVQVSAEKPYSAELSGWGIQWGAALAYAFGFAEERGDTFNFDFPTIKDSPLVPTAGDERHHLVLSGTVGLPWDVKLSSVVVLGSGVPFNISDASQGFGPTEFKFKRNGGRAEELIQFQQVDVRLAKDFKLARTHKVSGFIECFNLFNATNFGDYDGFIAPLTGTPNPDFGKPRKLVAPPRSVQAGVAYQF